MILEFKVLVYRIVRWGFAPLGYGVNLFLEKNGVLVIYKLTAGIGDIAMITAIVRNLKKDYKVIVCSRYPEFFDNNYKSLEKSLLPIQ